MNVYLDSVGCRLNQAEIDRYAAELTAQGHTITQQIECADLVVINTCAVTAAAAADSRARIRRAARNPNARIVVTGCWSEIEADAARRFPGVAQVVPNAEKDRLVGRLRPFISGAALSSAPICPAPVHAHGRTRFFLKVQDGCDNFCSFCVTRLARGKARSVPVEPILREIRGIEDAGGKEVVLTGVNLGAWGLDFEPKRTLTDLLCAILRETSVPRIRLSSLENWNLDLDFVSLWEDDRLLPHFHLPLQSGSPSVLRRMVRRTKPEGFLRLIEAARRVRGDFSITTDIIVGFPGETEEAFNETLRFAAAAAFSGGHVFPFSPRPGTAAAKLPEPVANEVKKERSARLRAQLDAQKDAFSRAQLGARRRILWEHGAIRAEGGYRNRGLTDNYLAVAKTSETVLTNRISEERILALQDGVLLA